MVHLDQRSETVPTNNVQATGKSMKTNKIKQIKLESRYFGIHSIAFWQIIDQLSEPDRSKLYALGAALQRLEEQTLNELKTVKPDFIGDVIFSHKDD